MSDTARSAISAASSRVAPVAGSVARRVAPAVGWLLARLADVARGAVGRWNARPGERQRRLRRRASVPLPNLYDVHADVRRATPREIGLRSIDLDDIVGTAVAGAAQRGSDFLPLPAFRSRNWASRWQRILRAVNELAILPPVDLVRYGGKYWVLDGHNRIAAAHKVGQVEVDANVTELVPPGQNPSERPGNLAASLTGSTAMRAAGRGERLRTMRDDEVPTVRPGDFDGRASAATVARTHTPAEPEPEPEPEPVAAEEIKPDVA